LRKYVTISILREVKEILEREKKNRDWSEFLLELYREAKMARTRMTFEQLRRMLNDKELDEILAATGNLGRGLILDETY